MRRSLNAASRDLYPLIPGTALIVNRFRTLLVCLAVCCGGQRAVCADETAAQPSAEDLSFFEQKIRPLMADKCFECHAADSKGVKGGLRVDSRDALLAGGDSGPAVAPGKPHESLLIEAVSYDTESLQMPPRGKLAARDIELLTEWVRRGAPFPGQSPQSSGTRAAGIDYDAGRKFWSFQPLTNVPVPAIDDSHWARGPIDAFVLSKLKEQQL
ncbi:MAG: hypothetical protein EHM42_05995, partial [Planctomycetaceae bacterium]